MNISPISNTREPMAIVSQTKHTHTIKTRMSNKMPTETHHLVLQLDRQQEH